MSFALRHLLVARNKSGLGLGSVQFLLEAMDCTSHTLACLQAHMTRGQQVLRYMTSVVCIWSNGRVQGNRAGHYDRLCHLLAEFRSLEQKEKVSFSKIIACALFFGPDEWLWYTVQSTALFITISAHSGSPAWKSSLEPSARFSGCATSARKILWKQCGWRLCAHRWLECMAQSLQIGRHGTPMLHHQVSISPKYHWDQMSHKSHLMASDCGAFLMALLDFFTTDPDFGWDKGLFKINESN